MVAATIGDDDGKETTPKLEEGEKKEEGNLARMRARNRRITYSKRVYIGQERSDDGSRA